ncbi:hypothetical protein [Aeromicrobium sp. 9AM]|uniref:hypothetical protein n=1 Tax=Aeromicrobium sp. 9AM TaxID=2653126 RepID=UPI00135CE0FB|nr:hypothetical protein [Aeromicrobium sp. 9AM]
MQLAIGGVAHNWTEVRSPEFWRTYLADEPEITVTYQLPYQIESASLAFEKIQTLLGEKLSADAWTDSDGGELRTEISEAVSTQREAAHASMSDSLAQTEKRFVYAGVDQSFANVASHLLGSAGLVRELLDRGFVDENFTLYVTQFPGQSISASAMNYIIKAVQPDAMDIDYHFGATEEVATGDIDAVLDAESARVLGGQSIYNIEIFDHLLATRPSKLSDPIRRLAANAESHPEFIAAYISSGQYSASFVRLLSAHWPSVFEYLIGQDPDSLDVALVGAALEGVSPALAYKLSEPQRDAIAGNLANFEAMTEPQAPDRARSIARTLSRMGIVSVDLSLTPAPMREELVARSLYEPTLANLRAIFGSDDLLPLDAIKESRAEDVYIHVISHMRDYLLALDEAPEVRTIAQAENFAVVLNDVGSAVPELVAEVAGRADPDCALGDLETLNTALWPSVAAAHRLLLTRATVSTYIAEYGFDEVTVEWLTSAGSIAPDGDSAETLSLALEILNTDQLADDAKLRLIETLDLQAGSIAVDDLSATAHPLLPVLVRNGSVTDDSDAYACLTDEEWETKEALITASVEFPEYMLSLAMSTTDLWIISARPVPEPVKNALLDNLTTFNDDLGPRGAGALASWAAAEAKDPSPEAVLTLAKEGGPASAPSIVALLGAQASSIDIDLLKAALNAIGDPYERLTKRGWERPKVPDTVGMEAVLLRLRSVDIVSKFKRHEKKRVFEVSKRRP